MPYEQNGTPSPVNIIRIDGYELSTIKRHKSKWCSISMTAVPNTHTKINRALSQDADITFGLYIICKTVFTNVVKKLLLLNISIIAPPEPNRCQQIIEGDDDYRRTYFVLPTTRNLLSVWAPVNCKYLVLMAWKIGMKLPGLDIPHFQSCVL